MVKITRYKGMCWRCPRTDDFGEYVGGASSSDGTKLYRIGENLVCKECLLDLLRDGRYKNIELKQDILDELPEIKDYAKTIKVIQSTRTRYKKIK